MSSESRRPDKSPRDGGRRGPRANIDRSQTLQQTNTLLPVSAISPSFSSPLQVNSSVAYRSSTPTARAGPARRAVTGCQEGASQKVKLLDSHFPPQEALGSSLLHTTGRRSATMTEDRQKPAERPTSVPSVDHRTSCKHQIAEVIQNTTQPRERKRILEKKLNDWVRSTEGSIAQRCSAIKQYSRAIDQQEGKMEELEREKHVQGKKEPQSDSGKERGRKKAAANKDQSYEVKQDRKEEKRRYFTRQSTRADYQGSTVTTGFIDQTPTSPESPIAPENTRAAHSSTRAVGHEVATTEAGRPNSPISPTELQNMVKWYFPS